MQIKRIIATAGAITAATLIAGVASTASNTMPDNGVAGYDQVTASGLTVSNIAYVVDSADASKLESIVFTSTDTAEAAGSSATLTTAGSTTACSAPALDDNGTPTDATDDTYTFTCNRSVLIESVTTVGFTVTKDAV